MENKSPERKIIKISQEAFKSLAELKNLLQDESPVSNYSALDAASLAIIKMTERKRKAHKRKEEMVTE